MEIAFYKLTLAGKDYLCLEQNNKSSLSDSNLKKLAEMICKRTNGVGSLGLIKIEKVLSERLELNIIDDTGKEPIAKAEAIMCAGRYIYDSGLSKSTEFNVYCNGKRYDLQIIDSKNVCLDLAKPFSIDRKEELKELVAKNYNQVIEVEQREIICTPLYLVFPQVVFYCNLLSIKFEKLQEKLLIYFSPKTYCSKVKINSKELLRITSWPILSKKRQAYPETAAACLAASVLNGLVDREAVIKLEQGNLFCKWDEVSNHIFISGSVEYIFTGKYYLNG